MVERTWVGIYRQENNLCKMPKQMNSPIFQGNIRLNFTIQMYTFPQVSPDLNHNRLVILLKFLQKIPFNLVLFSQGGKFSKTLITTETVSASYVDSNKLTRQLDIYLLADRILQSSLQQGFDQSENQHQFSIARYFEPNEIKDVARKRLKSTLISRQ